MAKTLSIKKKHLECITEFLNSELEDMSGIKDWDYESVDGEHIEIRVEFENEDKGDKFIRFRFVETGTLRDQLQMELEGSGWRDVDYFQSSVKWFWINLLW